MPASPPEIAKGAGVLDVDVLKYQKAHGGLFANGSRLDDMARRGCPMPPARPLPRRRRRARALARSGGSRKQDSHGQGSHTQGLVRSFRAVFAISAVAHWSLPPPWSCSPRPAPFEVEPEAGIEVELVTPEEAAKAEEPKPEAKPERKRTRAEARSQGPAKDRGRPAGRQASTQTRLQGGTKPARRQRPGCAQGLARRSRPRTRRRPAAATPRRQRLRLGGCRRPEPAAGGADRRRRPRGPASRRGAAAVRGGDDEADVEASTGPASSTTSATEKAKLTPEEIAAFRAAGADDAGRRRPAAAEAKLQVVIRVSFKRNGALAGEPMLIAGDRDRPRPARP